MPDDKAGNAAAEKAATESAVAEKTAPPEGSARPSSEVQRRIDELTGELGRKNAKIAKLEADAAAEVEKRKTEDEKRIDALVNERVAPFKSRLEKIEQAQQAELDELVKVLPESAKPALLPGDYPVEDRLRNARAVANLIGSKAQAKPFEAGATPGGTTEKRTYTLEQFRDWQNLPGKQKFKEFEELKPEMNAAYREGRIIGIGG